ncbi:MAG: Hsp20/alpha crystallin family protein [Bacteroidota bacterium]
MTLIKWKRPNGVLRRPAMLPEFRSLFDDLMMDDFFGRDFAHHMPAVNISEDNDGFRVELSAPGFSKEEMKVSIENDVMTISAERKTEKSEEERNYTRKEFNYGSFTRSFTLPETADLEKVDAKYENGILILSIAKKDSAKVSTKKEIQIS